MSSSLSQPVVRMARGVALGLAVVAFIWAGWLILMGGGDVNILGIRLRSHEPLRPFTIGCVTLAAFVLLGGRVPSVSAWGRGERIQVLALSLAVSIFGVVYGTTAAVGSDPYGYVSQAELWLAGDLRVDQPWVAEAPWPSKYRSFSPLGYRPSPTAGAADGSIVPTYPPGLALLMAGAKLVAGQEAMFWVAPLAGGFLVLATYGVGRRVAPPGAAIVATWLMASCPAMLYMLVQPMSDVPAAAALTAMCYFLLHTSVRAGACAGIAAALTLLLRPNLVFVAVIGAAWLLWRARTSEGRGLAVWSLVAFVSCASTGAVAVALINHSLYGSPFELGHGDPGVLFDWSHFWPNLVRYSSWLVQSQTVVATAGVAALMLPWRRLWPDIEHRRRLALPASLLVSVVLFYCFYLVFDEWWYLRFLLPVLPLVAIGTGAVAAGIRRAGGRTASALVAIGIVLVVMTQYRFAVNRGVLDLWSGERRYVGVARLVRAQTDENSVIFSLQHCGSLRYYAGRTTLRFDNLDGESLDEAVQWLSSRNVRSYLLVEEWEVAMFRERFGGQAVLARLETPLAIYRGDRHPATLYDLGRAATGEPKEIPNPTGALRSIPPAASALLNVR